MVKPFPSIKVAITLKLLQILTLDVGGRRISKNTYLVKIDVQYACMGYDFKIEYP